MGLMDQIRLDVQRITSDTRDFAVIATMTAPPNSPVTVPPSEVLDIAVIHTKHHLGIDTEGNMVNSKKASIALSEALLVSPYPCRDSNQEVDLKNHKVSVKDSTGVLKHYMVKEWFPDEAIGLIVLILESFE